MNIINGLYMDRDMGTGNTQTWGKDTLTLEEWLPMGREKKIWDKGVVQKSYKILYVKKNVHELTAKCSFFKI